MVSIFLFYFIKNGTKRSFYLKLFASYSTSESHLVRHDDEEDICKVNGYQLNAMCKKG